MQTSPDRRPAWIAERCDRARSRALEAELRAAQEQVAKLALAVGALPYGCDFLQSLQTNIAALSDLDMRATLTAISKQPKAPQLSSLTAFAPPPFARHETLTLEFREAEAYIDVRGPLRDLVRLSYDPSAAKVVGLRDDYLDASDLAESVVRDLVELVNSER